MSMNRLCTALHEAGHAVTAYRLRVPLYRVTIEPDGARASLGHVILDGWAVLWDHPEARRWRIGAKRTVALARVFIAGAAGANLEATDPPDLGLFNDVQDLELAVNLLREDRGLPPCDMSETMEIVVQDFVDNIDCLEWRLAVVELAAVLLKRRTVARYTVKKVTRAAYADPNPERWQASLARLSHLAHCGNPLLNSLESPHEAEFRRPPEARIPGGFSLCPQLSRSRGR